MVQELPQLGWFFDNSDTASSSYVFSNEHIFPRPPDVNTTLPGIEFVTIMAEQSSGNPDLFNATSNLVTNLATLVDLNISIIQCGSSAVRSDETNVTYSIQCELNS